MKWLWLTTLVVALDQATKQLAEFQLILYRPVSVIDGFFNFTLVYNRGAAFSFLSDADGWQRWFFMALSSIISIVLFMWLIKLPADKKILACGLALILGGALGNLIDRTLFGHVIDFLDVYYQGYHWPAFNLADAAITLGAICLILDMFKDAKKHG
jgi:signal peptidase II